MVRSRVTATLLIALVVAPLVLLAVACSRAPEQQFLSQFFRAARARDNTTLGMMSAVQFDPREQGTVTSFDIVSVTPEERAPLGLKALIDTARKVRETEAEFSKRKQEYQNANLRTIEELIKVERDPKAKMTPALAKIKPEWDKWREETSAHAKATAAARAALSAAIGPAEASLTQPGQPAMDPEKFDGDMISKSVTLNAQVQSPEGQTSPKTLVVTMRRAVGQLDGQARDGRWVITQITGA